jgi:predicted Zn-dependent protease
LAEAKEQIRELTKTIFSRSQTKQEQLEILRQKTLENSEDPHVWEQLALQLALQKNPQIHEVSHAYRRAENLYRDRGDHSKADDIARILKRIG